MAQLPLWSVVSDELAAPVAPGSVGSGASGRLSC